MNRARQRPLPGNREPFPVPPIRETPQRADGFIRPEHGARRLAPV